jgi:hypothetical protein
MRAFETKLPESQQASTAASTRLPQPHVGQHRDVNAILNLQRTVGNQALLRANIPEDSNQHKGIINQALLRLQRGADVPGDQQLPIQLAYVRLHTDETADRGCQERDAVAYTSGRDIYLRRGLEPSSEAGQTVIRHELVHVVQQLRGVAGMTVAPTRVLEHEANVLSGLSPAHVTAPPGAAERGSIQCLELGAVPRELLKSVAGATERPATDELGLEPEARKWLDSLDLSKPQYDEKSPRKDYKQSLRQLKAKSPEIARAINRFYGLNGFDQVLRSFWSGDQNNSDGARFTIEAAEGLFQTRQEALDKWLTFEDPALHGGRRHDLTFLDQGRFVKADTKHELEVRLRPSGGPQLSGEPLLSQFEHDIWESRAGSEAEFLKDIEQFRWIFSGDRLSAKPHPDSMLQESRSAKRPGGGVAPKPPFSGGDYARYMEQVPAGGRPLDIHEFVVERVEDLLLQREVFAKHRFIQSLMRTEEGRNKVRAALRRIVVVTPTSKPSAAPSGAGGGGGAAQNPERPFEPERASEQVGAPEPAGAAKQPRGTEPSPKQGPPGPRATKAEIEPFRLPEVYAGQGGPAPAGGAAEGAAQVLIEWEHFESMHSEWKRADLTSAAYTLQWWASKGVYPKAYAIRDWPVVSDKRISVSANSLGTVGEIDGLEVNVPDAEGIKAFERWATEHLRSYDDFVRYMLSEPGTPIIRDGDGQWLIREWKWGDWWPASTYSEEEPDDQLTRFMEPLLKSMIGQTASDLASLRSGSSFHPLGRSLGVRKFKGGDRADLYSPTEPDLRLLYAYQLSRSATFVELDASTMIPEYAAIPPELVLVTGGDISTYAALRESLIRVTRRHPTIGLSSPQARVPNIHAVALVRRDALE